MTSGERLSTLVAGTASSEDVPRDVNDLASPRQLEQFASLSDKNAADRSNCAPRSGGGSGDLGLAHPGDTRRLPGFPTVLQHPAPTPALVGRRRVVADEVVEEPHEPLRMVLVWEVPGALD